MSKEDELQQAREQGAAWALNAARARGLTKDVIVTRESAGDGVLDALSHRLVDILNRLADAVSDLLSEHGEEFARAFEEAARDEIARHVPSFTQYLH